jgi:hypothetical protein
MSNGGAFSTRRIRGSMFAFAIGKAVSAPLNLLLILVLVAVMPREEYAAYVGAVALLEISFVLGTFGLEWVMQTTLAAVLVRGNSAQLVHSMLLLGLLPVLPYLLLAGVLWQFAPQLAAMMGNVVPEEVIRLYAVLLAIDGPCRMLRDQMMGALMMQHMSQLAQVARIVTLFGIIGTFVLIDAPVDAVAVGKAEIAATALSLLVTLLALSRYLRRVWPRRRMSWALETWLGWRSVRFAAHAYGSYVMMLPLGTELLTALVARYLGADATAAYGFVARLMETARRYLPMDMFYSVLRPATIGRYESTPGGNFPQLVQDTNRMLAANLVIIGAGMAVAIAGGDRLVHLLSKGNVESPTLLLAALLTLLVSHTVRRGVELVAYIVGHSGVFVTAALISVLAPPVTVVLLTTTQMVQFAPLGVVFVDFAFSALALLGLRRYGRSVAFEYSRWRNIAIATLGGGVAGASVAWLVEGVPGMWLAIVVALAAFVALMVALRVIDADERAWIVSMVRMRRAPASS